jgi:hypothetical protein
LRDGALAAGEHRASDGQVSPSMSVSFASTGTVTAVSSFVVALSLLRLAHH